MEEPRRRCELKKGESQGVDEKQPGCIRANAAGVEFAAAFWCHDLAPLRESMDKHAQYQLESIAQLEELVMGDTL